MRADNYFSTNKDLTFYYEKVIDWQRLVPLFAESDDAARPGETAGSWREVLGVAGDYIGRQISARAAEVDRLGTPHTGDIQVSPPMADNLRGLADLGLIGLGIPREYGGEGMPFVVHSAVFEMLARADAATMVQYAFYSSPAAMILRFGSHAQKQRWVPQLATGRRVGRAPRAPPETRSDGGNVSTTATRPAHGPQGINRRK